jgi:hypothetical protein
MDIPAGSGGVITDALLHPLDREKGQDLTARPQVKELLNINLIKLSEISLIMRGFTLSD